MPAKIVAPYAISDIDLPLRIFKKQAAELKKLGLWDLFLMESKLIPMLVAMHRRGVRVDLDAAEQLYRSMSERQNMLMAQIKQRKRSQHRPMERPQHRQGFRRARRYPMAIRKRPKRRHSPEAWLAQHEHPIAQLVNDVRRLDKLKENLRQGCSCSKAITRDASTASSIN